tara:strand:- start:91 stop:648 length:558 start_codon:yes stop_codon:yes gene_type:complete
MENKNDNDNDNDNDINSCDIRDVEDLHMTQLLLKKTKSYDTRSCIICLITQCDKNNNEDINLNCVCNTCRYYIHDSCFSKWYQNNNKCIICREPFDIESDNEEYENQRYLSPRSRAFLRIIEQPSFILFNNHYPRPPSRVNGGMFRYAAQRASHFVNTVYFCCIFGFLYLLINGWIFIDDSLGSL